MNQRKSYPSVIWTLGVIGMALPLSSNAATPSQFEKISVKVSYADLNIESDAGARALYSRLKRASRKACNVKSLTSAGSLREVRSASRCYDQTLEAAVREIDSDALTRIHSS